VERVRRSGQRGPISTVVLLAIAILVSVTSGCGPGASVPTDRPDDESTAQAPTTPAVEPTPAPSPTGAAGVPDVLAADATGVRLVTATGVVSVTDHPATLAVPDLTGGVVLQHLVHTPTGFIFGDETAGRNVHVWDEGGPDPILRVREPGEAPEVLVEHPDGLLTLVDVVLVGGRPQVLYRLLVGGPASRESAEDQVIEWLRLQDVASGQGRTLGRVGSFESSGCWIRIGGGLVGVTYVPYGEGATLVGSFPATDLDGLGEDAWIPAVATDHLVLGPGTVCRPGDPCSAWALATAARDGSRLSWVQGGVTVGPSGVVTPWPIDVRSAGPIAAVEQRQVDLGILSAADANPAAHPTGIDDDGTHTVVSGAGPDRKVLLVTDLGEVVDLGLDGAVVRFWVAGG
jgi:hypothetical protein